MEIIENKILKLYILKTFTDFRERERKGGWEGGGEGGREREREGKRETLICCST